MWAGHCSCPRPPSWLDEFLAGIFGTLHGGEYWRCLLHRLEGNVSINAAAVTRQELLRSKHHHQHRRRKQCHTQGAGHTSSVARTPVITNIELQSLTVAALQAHQQPPDAMQTSEPCFPEMSTISQSLGLRVQRSTVTVRAAVRVPMKPRGCCGGRGFSPAEMRKLLPQSKASYRTQKFEPPRVHVGGRRTRQELGELVAGEVLLL